MKHASLLPPYVHCWHCNRVYNFMTYKTSGMHYKVHVCVHTLWVLVLVLTLFISFL
jgi:hypothetical protein